MFGIEDFSQLIVDYGNFDPSQLGKAAVFGGAILLIGMATIFTVLFVLWLCLTLFKLFFTERPDKKTATVAPVTDAPITPVATSDESEEIVAVIAAAIAMAESEAAGIKFKVVSFKRK